MSCPRFLRRLVSSLSDRSDRGGFVRVGTAGALALTITCTALPQGYICAEGGGGITGGNWAPGVFGWMVEHGGDANVVILGVSGIDTNAANAFLAAGASNVTHLNVTSFNANAPEVAATIAAADIVWMRGGDQANYVTGWNGTLTEQAIRSVWEKGGVVGGTSAGCAVLGDVVYDAIVGSLAPKAALQNAGHPFLTFTHDFLNLTPGVIFDTHFTERGRLGRLPVMLARIYEDHGLDLIGVGVDDRTAFCVYPDGTAEVRGDGAVTILHRTPATVQIMEPGDTPVITALAHTQLIEGYTYDLSTRTVIDRPRGSEVAAPTQHPSVTQQLVLNGSGAVTPIVGEWRAVDGGDSLALFLGKLELVAGTGTLSQTAISSTTWNSAAFAENQTGGVQYAIATHPHMLGLYLDGGVRVETTPPHRLTVLEASLPVESATMILDAHGMVSRAFSTAISSGNSVGPRQSVAIEDATLHLLRRDWGYRLDAHWPVSPAGEADLNLDGVVDGADLGILLSHWGTVDGAVGWSAAADLNSDGVVDGADLGILLSSWSSR